MGMSFSFPSFYGALSLLVIAFIFGFGFSFGTWFFNLLLSLIKRSDAVRPS